MTISRRRSIGTRILVSLTVSILVIEAIILGFTALSHRRSLIDHYLFEGMIISRTLGEHAASDPALLDAARDRLRDEQVLAIRPAGTTPLEEDAAYGGRFRIDGEVLTYRRGALEIDMDITHIPGLVAAYAIRIFGLVLIIVAFVTVAVYLVLRPQLVIPLRRLLERLESISGTEADLTQRLAVTTNNEVGAIATEFNTFSENLRTIVSAIQSTVSDLIAGAGELETSSRDALDNVTANQNTMQTMQRQFADLDQNIQAASTAVGSIAESISQLNTSVYNQADAIADSTAAVEEMDASVHSLDRIARDKKQVTDQMVELAHAAGERMTASVNAIGTVETSTQDMLEMIDVINTVAEQTNLLAMNAAIEAAHAGDAGRGFAVVAAEIRKLSELSAENATKINTSLRKDIAMIHEAGEINRTAGDAFDRIMSSVKDVADAMGQIMAGLDEQSHASVEIVKAITRIREVSAAVQSESDRINGEVETINSTTDELARGSRAVRQQSDEVARRITTITTAIDQVNSIVARNRQRMQTVNREIDRFRTTPDDLHK